MSKKRKVNQSGFQAYNIYTGKIDKKNNTKIIIEEDVPDRDVKKSDYDEVSAEEYYEMVFGWR